MVNTRGLLFEWGRVVREAVLVPILLYGSETMEYMDKERSRIRAVQIDNYRGLLGIMRIYRVPNA